MSWPTERRFRVTFESAGWHLAKIEPGHYMGEFGLVDVYFTCTNIFGEEWSAYVFDFDESGETVDVALDAGPFPTLRDSVEWAKRNLVPEPTDEILDRMGSFYERRMSQLKARTAGEIDQTLQARMRRA